MLNVVSFLLGDYAQTSIFDTFLAKKEERSVNNDVARMQGKRFVSAIESESERRLSEVLVKQLTGGDTITARFLFAEFFEFKPQFKIWLACNHKPVIRGTDLAIWRRIRLIPFSITISENERDKHLTKKLETELPGILTWAVQGCLEWQKEGLKTPGEVKDATNEYQTDMDVIQAFLDDRCFIMTTSDDVKTVSGKLYEVYVNWCSENGETPLNNKSFGRRLTEKGFVSKQSGGKRWLHGVGVKH
jgi:putative DNA primase/helicase